MRIRLTVFTIFLLTLILECPAQTISGIVTTDKEPLPGVTVFNKNSNKGTITDAKGEFTIDGKTGDTIDFTFIGFASKQVIVGNSTKLSIDLAFDQTVSTASIISAISTSSLQTPSDNQRLNTSLKAMKNQKNGAIKALEKVRASNLNAIDRTGKTEAEINNEIQAIEDEFAKGLKEIEINYKNGIRIFVAAVKYDVFFPAKDKFTAIQYFDSKSFKEFEFFGQNNLTAWANNGSVSSEIIAGYLGPIRVSLNSILAKQKAITPNPADISKLDQKGLQNLLLSIDSSNKANSTLFKVASGGGEGALVFKYPLINTEQSPNISNTSFSSELLTNFTANLPIAGSYITNDETSFFGYTQLQNKLIVRLTDRTDAHRFDFFSYLTGSLVYGSKKFYETILIEDKKVLGMLDFMGGVRFDNFSIYYTNQFFSHHDLKNKITGRLGLSLNIK
ncbi:carboxypeptidase-like regulatory domain-containing protein [Emticicia fontis]